jgi:hypothetical protein
MGGAGAVLGVEDVDAVPAAGARGRGGDSLSCQQTVVGSYRAARTLLQQYTACKAIVHVPQVDTRYAALKVPVCVSNSPCLHLMRTLTAPCTHQRPHSP